MIKASEILGKTWSQIQRISFHQPAQYAYIHSLHKGLIPSVLAPYTWIYSQTTYAKQDRTNSAGSEGGGLMGGGGRTNTQSSAPLKPHKCWGKKRRGRWRIKSEGGAENKLVSGLTCTLKKRDGNEIRMADFSCKKGQSKMLKWMLCSFTCWFLSVLLQANRKWKWKKLNWYTLEVHTNTEIETHTGLNPELINLLFSDYCFSFIEGLDWGYGKDFHTALIIL